MKKTVFVFAMLLSASLCLSACSGKNSSSAGSVDDKNKTAVEGSGENKGNDEMTVVGAKDAGQMYQADQDRTARQVHDGDADGTSDEMYYPDEEEKGDDSQDDQADAEQTYDMQNQNGD